MIEKISFNSRITEVNSIAMRMLYAYKDSLIHEDQHLDAIMNDAGLLSAKLGVAINRIKSQLQLEEKDEQCEQAVYDLYCLLKGFTHHPIPELQQAAVAILEVFDHYGLSNLKESYDIQSSLIHSLLDDLAKPEMQAHLELLSGAVECMKAIRLKLQDFETFRLAFESDKIEESTYANASSIKKELIKLINKQLLVYLKAMSIVNNNAYCEFTRVVTQIIIDNNSNVRRRREMQPVEIEN